jgi:hypothetical protein
MFSEHVTISFAFSEVPFVIAATGGADWCCTELHELLNCGTKHLPEFIDEMCRRMRVFMQFYVRSQGVMGRLVFRQGILCRCI